MTLGKTDTGAPARIGLLDRIAVRSDMANWRMPSRWTNGFGIRSGIMAFPVTSDRQPDDRRNIVRYFAGDGRVADRLVICEHQCAGHALRREYRGQLRPTGQSPASCYIRLSIRAILREETTTTTDGIIFGISGGVHPTVRNTMRISAPCWRSRRRTGRRCFHTLTKSDFPTAGSEPAGPSDRIFRHANYSGWAIPQTGDQRRLRDAQTLASDPPDQVCPERL